MDPEGRGTRLGGERKKSAFEDLAASRGSGV